MSLDGWEIWEMRERWERGSEDAEGNLGNWRIVQIFRLQALGWRGSRTECLSHVFPFPISPPQASQPGYSYSSIALSSVWYSALLVNCIYCLSLFPHWTWFLWRKGIFAHGCVSSPWKTAWHIVGPHKHFCWIGDRKRSTWPFVTSGLLWTQDDL